MTHRLMARVPIPLWNRLVEDTEETGSTVSGVIVGLLAKKYGMEDTAGRERRSGRKARREEVGVTQPSDDAHQKGTAEGGC